MTDTGPTVHEGTGLGAGIYAPGSDQGDDGEGDSGIDLKAMFSLQLGALRDLGDTMQSMRDELAKWRKMQNEYPAMIPQVGVLNYSNVNPTAIGLSGTAGVGVLIGGPDQGRCWSVRNIIVGPVQVTGTAPAGSAYFLVSPAPPTDLSITSARAIALTLPNVATYGARELFLNPNENLYMVIVNGGNGSQYVAACAVQDEPYRPIQGVVED